GGKPRRKSHPRTTKNCRCREREGCPHPWISADAGAGTVVKTGGVMHWAHKASTLCFAGQGVLLDAVSMTDAATHDSKSVEPHLSRLFARFPELKGVVVGLLDDGAADDRDLKDRVAKDFDVELVTSQNPRGRKPLTKDLPRGIEKVTPTGTPICLAKLPMDFVGCRHTTGHFIFAAPDAEDGRPACEGCPLKARCCRPGTERRQASIAFERLPWLDPVLPQLSQRFTTLMAQRTVIERVHNLMKHVFGESRLRKRGTASAQATLDKTLWAMHVVLART
ncbi:MAG: transposase, partial [Chloroflexota bacterium]